MSTQKTLLGVLSGVAIGAIAGILFAPEKGEKTREKLASKAQDVRGGLEQNYGVASEKLHKNYDELKVVGSDLIQKGKAELAKIKDELKHTTNGLASKGKVELSKAQKNIENTTEELTTKGKKELSKLQEEVA